MNETATETAYDPIPDLAWLLGAAQRQADGYDASGGIRTYARRLAEGLRLPELASAAEAYVAISRAIAPQSVTKGDVITIVPERGPQRRMLIAHVEHHIITLADLEDRGETGETS